MEQAWDAIDPVIVKKSFLNAAYPIHQMERRTIGSRKAVMMCQVETVDNEWGPYDDSLTDADM